MTTNDHSITKHTFIDIFTQRPTDAGPMPTDELLHRLDITLAAIKEDQKTGEKRLAVAAANCLRGALIRLSQAYGDAAVEQKVRELVSITADITGI
jgi:hypothetical protein